MRAKEGRQHKKSKLRRRKNRKRSIVFQLINSGSNKKSRILYHHRISFYFLSFTSLQ